jgi:hypothetical protein
MSHEPTFGQGLEVAGIVMKAIASGAKKGNIDSDGVQEKIVGNPGVLFDFFENLFSGNKKENKPVSISKLLSAGETLKIEKLDGKRFIGGAKQVFKSYIDGDFKGWDLNKTAEATEEISVQVHELIGDAIFAKMFTSLTGDLDKLCLTQDQIISFCEKYPSWLRQEGCATFFLFKMNGEYFVAYVFVFSDGLYVYVHHLGYDRVWDGECRHRVVVPQSLVS